MITDNGECGLLYPPGNEEALHLALMQTTVINIEAKRKLTLSYFKSKLSFEAIADKINRIASTL